MTDNIKEVSDRVQKCADFREKYPNAPGSLDARTAHLGIVKQDCALAGKVFGKTDWKRKSSWNNNFNWTRTIDDVEITIHDAEANEFINSPVPTSAFPIQLEDESEDEIPF